MTCALPSCYVSETLRENGYRHALRTPLVKAIELYELPKDIPIATLCAGSACALILRGYTSFGYVNGFRVRVRRSGIDEKAVTTRQAPPWQRQPQLSCRATTSRRAPCLQAQAKRRRSPSDQVCDTRRQTRSLLQLRARS